MSDEWGPWIEHDGKGCPVPGSTLVAITFRRCPPPEYTPLSNPSCDRAGVWQWHHDGACDDIIRYRVRKPKGLEILQRIAADPDPVEADA